MAKIDLKAELKDFYKPSSKVVSEVIVPEFNFLMADGYGNPNTLASYASIVEALFTASYTIKFSAKNDLGVDYTVMPLEGLWWAEDHSAFLTDDRENWQ